MFEGAMKHRFSLVTFFGLNRLSREGTLRTLEYLHKLSACGVAYKSLTEPYLDSMCPRSLALRKV